MTLHSKKLVALLAILTIAVVFGRLGLSALNITW